MLKRVFITGLFCLLFASNALSQELVQNRPVVIQELIIHMIEEPVDSDITKQLVPFQQGQVSTIEEIDTTFSEVRKLEFMEDFSYEIIPIDQDNINLVIYIKEYRIVRGISVRGNYPFLSKEIKRLIPLQPGSAFRQELLEDSRQSVLEYLEKNGYYDSKVSVTAKPHKRLPLADIKIRIQRGHFYRIRGIEVDGNTAFRDSRIRNKISRGSRFQEKRLKKDIRRIKKLYANNGYVKARIKVEDKTFDDEKKVVNLDLSVRENKKLVLTFSGKKVLSSVRLRDVAALDEKRAYDRYAIGQAEKRIETYYKKSGYPNVEIAPTTFKRDNVVYIDFEINAGRRVELSNIRFEGNKQIGDGKLKKIIVSRKTQAFSPGIYNERELQKDRLKIFTHYKEQGFLDIQVSEPEVVTNELGDQRLVTFYIDEGKQYRIASVEFYGLPDESLLFTEKLALRDNKVYNSKRFFQTKDKILENLYDLGYAYTTVGTEVIRNKEEATVNVIFRVEAGEIARVRNIVIKGNYKTKTSIIKQNLEFKPGDLFNYQKVLNSQLNLRKLGIFSNVRVNPLGYADKSNKIDVLIQLLESRTITTNFQVGYDNRSSVRGEVNFTKKNLFGYAKQNNTRFIGGLNFNRVETTFFAPRIFGASLNLSNQYFLEYEDAPIFDAVAYGGFVSILKNFGRRWTIGVRDQITRSEVLENKSNTALLGNSLFDNTLNEFRVFAYFDARDSFSDPQKGVYLYLNNELNVEITNPVNTFNTVEFGASHHKRLLKRVTFNHTLRYGQIFSVYPNATVPFNELFFMGGADTLRGFSEDGANSSGGTLRMIYNAELHLRLADAFKLATFFDAGVLDADFSNVTMSDVRESAGLGIRYFTPVGPIRLDYGFILDRQVNEPRSRLHFSFGYYF